MKTMNVPSRQHRLFLTLVLAGAMTGCTSTQTNNGLPDGAAGRMANDIAATSSYVIGGPGIPLIPDNTIHIGPSVSYPLEKLVYWGAWIGAAYLILDPLSPNWQIEEARLPENHIHFQLAMKRFYSGGAGEARVIFHRRAKELMRAGGFGSYEVVEYSEGMESSVLGSQRVAEGVVRFKKTTG